MAIQRAIYIKKSSRPVAQTNYVRSSFYPNIIEGIWPEAKRARGKVTQD